MNNPFDQFGLGPHLPWEQQPTTDQRILAELAALRERLDATVRALAAMHELVVRIDSELDAILAQID